MFVFGSDWRAKYTKARLPVQLMYWEEFETKSEALKREYQIKKYKRKQKLALIEGRLL